MFAAQVCARPQKVPSSEIPLEFLRIIYREQPGPPSQTAPRLLARKCLPTMGDGGGKNVQPQHRAELDGPIRRNFAEFFTRGQTIVGKIHINIFPRSMVFHRGDVSRLRTFTFESDVEKNIPPPDFGDFPDVSRLVKISPS